MRMVGFNFDKISVERKVDVVKGKVKISQNLNIVDAKILNFPEDKKQKVLKLAFEYDLNYNPKIGNISFKGNTLYIGPEKDVKDAEKQWKKDKKLNPGLTQSVLNQILSKSTIKALSLSEEIGLPPHLPLPRFAPKSKPEEYIG